LRLINIRVLSIDPEDLQAHYNLMLCYQGLGKPDEAKREEVLYRRFKADESSQAITGDYRRLHPEDNNERQQIHEHRSVTMDKANQKSVPTLPNKKGDYVAEKKMVTPARRKLVAMK
jgi:hypothetical protein